LLKPVADQLGNKRLLVVADGVLQYIPFAALPIPERGRGGDKRTREIRNPQSAIRNPQFVPLIVEHEIVNLPSASTLAVLRRETAGRRPAPKAVAALADPVFETDDMRVLAATGKVKGAPDKQASNEASASLPLPLARLRGMKRDGGFGRLPATLNEARAIEEVTIESERLIAKGFDASRARATDPALGQYRIIHFATHGVLDRDNPELSAIVLSLVDRQGRPQDGYLRLHDIYNLNLPAELVVLSACDTGLGKEFKGEGLIGLTRGFMYAGAARVMASLWKVEDEPTAKLMRHFYRHMLKDGLPPAAALRQAQIALWQDAEWRAPYFWAAFVIQGEWR
jgi:CHAT domain-containing protein